MSDNSSLAPDTTILDVIFIALSTPDRDILRAARNVSSSWLRTAHIQARASTAQPLPNSFSIHETLWQWIEALTAQGRRSMNSSVGFFLWSRMLELPVNASHLLQLVTNDGYGEKIQEAMVDGDMEIRRLSVFITRQTINLISTNDMEVKNKHIYIDRSPSGKATATSDFEKFCTVYETIVLGRYLNQVKDCLPTLDQLATPTSTTLPASWILTVLRPSVSNLMQESIRNLLGDWLMTRRFNAGLHFEVFGKLLHDRILPWAVQGSLFTSSVQGTRLSCRCEHGEKLAEFIETLLKTNETPGQAQASPYYLEMTVAFLEKSRHNISVYAIAYLVYGIYKAALSGPLSDLTDSELLTLADIPFTHGLQEVVQDLTAIMCLAVVKRIRVNTRSPRTPSDDKVRVALSTKLKALETKIDKICAQAEVIEPSNDVDWSSLHTFFANVQSTKHTCLAGSGLLKACRSLPSLMKDDAGELCDEELVVQILDAVWDEVEIQDYPKNVMISLPSVWLSPLCLRLCQSSEQILNRLKSFVNTFENMSRGRIYVWTPFMTSIRRALIIYPELAVVLDISEIISSVSKKVPTARHEFQLDAAIAGLTTSLGGVYSHLTYQHYYGEMESLGFAAFFDMVNRLSSINSSLSDRILQDIMDPWIHQKLPAPVVNKWKTTEQLQIMIILLESSGIRHDFQMAAKYLTHLLHMLKAEPMPRFRFPIEVMVSSLLKKHPGLLEDSFTVLSLNDHHGNPKYMGSVIRITVSIICSSVGTEMMASRFTERVLALTSSAKIIIRHEAQWSFPIFWNFANQKGWLNIIQNPALIGLNRYIGSLDKHMQTLADRENSKFNLDTDYTLANVLCGRYLKLEPAATALLEFADFEILYGQDKRFIPTPHELPTPSLSLGARPDGSINGAFCTQDVVSMPPTATTRSQPTQLALQTKGTSYLSASNADYKSSRHHSNLLVVGSLVDNPYNLGGISRVSEIFGAAGMYMSSLNVLTNKDFESVAVSSHMHMEVEALKIADMVAFFGKKRLEGFSIVGIEQTDRSVVLGDKRTRLPQKTILVLGAEKEGMPAAILAECDMLVEIPQQGYTRSLNVQTAAACVLYEYCRQFS
ncbi:hypothetical protein K461DRAFT_247613 [Myriangium duriaei CBS 260.36]|uniref:tRNA/rRNA methyltransferase SpoU type domain-containing protein n=1 Tax=Myriangium duriaei CBS 260.36 TaxID=1168546 RepID=A0A9P4IWQ1_9PEZI|nr:hypothetical protein K461DRAFT_247613 [Myriangium duriaei CBS 260.36]